MCESSKTLLHIFSNSSTEAPPIQHILQETDVHEDYTSCKRRKSLFFHRLANPLETGARYWPPAEAFMQRNSWLPARECLGIPNWFSGNRVVYLPVNKLTPQPGSCLTTCTLSTFPPCFLAAAGVHLSLKWSKNRSWRADLFSCITPWISSGVYAQVDIYRQMLKNSFTKIYYTRVSNDFWGRVFMKDEGVAELAT